MLVDNEFDDYEIAGRHWGGREEGGKPTGHASNHEAAVGSHGILMIRGHVMHKIFRNFVLAGETRTLKHFLLDFINK